MTEGVAVVTGKNPPALPKGIVIVIVVYSMTMVEGLASPDVAKKPGWENVGPQPLAGPPATVIVVAGESVYPPYPLGTVMVAGVPPDSPSRIFVVDAVLTAEFETASELNADDGRMVKFVKRVEVNGPGALNVGPCDGETRLEIPEILPDCVTVVVADSDSVIAAEMDADDVGNVGNTDELLLIFGEPGCEEEVAGDVDSATVEANVEDVWLVADDPLGVF